MSDDAGIVNLLVVGGGINGAGIACDAAGRGLSVLLVETGDLAGATSSASSKLIHGGLRYLEQREFRLVREALREREVMLAKAPHIVRPLRFVLPHVAGMRPRWLLRAGLFLYDHLYRRRAIPGSSALALDADTAGAPLRDGLHHGFAYWDCWVDDARLVVLNARAAADLGADVRTRTRFLGAVPEDGRWRFRLSDDTTGATAEGRARAIVNVAGPWVPAVRAALDGSATLANGGTARVRLVKGSHIVVPRVGDSGDAYILQHQDGRVVFALPFEDRFTLVGTTDVAFTGDPRGIAIDDAEVDYLLAAVNGYFRRPFGRDDVVWSYAGVRPLYDDDAAAPSAVTRDYRFELTGGNGPADPPALHVVGGKITTYRRLAEAALARLGPHLPAMGPAWTATAPLPGGDMAAADFEAFLAGLAARRPRFGADLLRRLTRRHGTITDDVIGDARSPQDLGCHIGDGLYAREVDHLKRREWARTPEDVLWRRTKAGLHLAGDEQAAAEDLVAGML